MATNHDDLPHPVPPYAYLRYKENWLFVILAPEQKIFGVAHINTEAGHDRARFSCNLNIDGKIYEYSVQTAFPSPFTMSPEIGGGKLRIRFVEPGARFELHLDSDELTADFVFLKRFPTFDYAACKYANPERMSAQELMTYGTNLPYTHQQQSLTVSGEIQVKGRGSEPRTLRISGSGYRDHTWGFRADNILAKHTWSALIFSDFVIGVKSLNVLSRPAAQCCEGYVASADGSRALQDIEISQIEDGPDGLGARVRYRLTDVYGQAFTVTADVAGRMAHVALPTGTPFRVVENFCPAILEQTGEKGISLTELGLNSAWRDTVGQS